MPIRFSIENQSSLPDGGPLSVAVSGRRGLDIGRDQHLDWTLPDPTRTISGKHCEVRFHDGAYWLHDVSTNGTFLNGSDHRMGAPHRLRNGDRVEIGHYIIAVAIDGEEALVQGDAQGEAQEQPRPAPRSGAALWDATDDAAPPAPRREFQPAREERRVHVEPLDWAMEPPPPVASPRRQPEPPPMHADPDDFAWASRPAPIRPPVEPPAPIPTPRHQPASVAPAPSPTPPASPWDDTSPFEAGPERSALPEQASERTVQGASAPVPPPPAELDAAVSARVPLPPAEPDAAVSARVPPPPARREAAAIPVAPPSSFIPPGEPRAPAGARPEILARFARGAGIPEEVIAGRDSEEFAELLGLLMKIVAEELKQLLAARAESKRMARSTNHTTVQALDNNPLKFSPTAQDALRLMFGQSTSGYLDARRTLEQSFKDLKIHQVKTYGAMQQALRLLVEDLDPQTIEEATAPESGLGALLTSRKAKLWDQYVARWNAKTAPHEDGLVDAFMLYFAECYDKSGSKNR